MTMGVGFVVDSILAVPKRFCRREPTFSTDVVVEILKRYGRLPPEELKKHICEETGCVRATAQRRIKDAEKEGKIVKVDGSWKLAENQELIPKDLDEMAHLAHNGSNEFK
jgi:hypothetical protein